MNDSLLASVLVFVSCTAVIGIVGTRLTMIADQLADRAGFGEAVVGGVLLGAVTSLSGIVLSVSAAFNDMPTLALSNALGGMAAQMVFLAVADICYRKSNLEHAAASAENMMQGAILVCVMSILLLACFSPEWTVWKVHPATPLMIGAYIYGMHLVNRSKKFPMWEPKMTEETRTDEPDTENAKLNLKRLWVSFLSYALLLGVTGWILQKSASSIVAITGMHEAIMGVLFTSVVTSLPELVTSVAAVRRGALTLAVSGIIGGNAYDTLFAAFSDVAYRSGSIYHTIPENLMFWVGINLFMTGVLILGLILREKRGPGNIGFESALILGAYALGAVTLIFG